MKTLTVSLLFALSLASLLASFRADAGGQTRIERVARPQPLMPDDGKGGDDKDDDEEDEEEYRRVGPRAALELVDPGALDHMLKLRAAAR